jgi:hypothetical protein
MSLGAHNMKTEPDALGTAENDHGCAKHENGTRRPRYHLKRVWERKTRKSDPTPPVPPKTSPGAQNMKTRLDALGTAENDYGCAKHENRTRHPRYGGK